MGKSCRDHLLLAGHLEQRPAGVVASAPIDVVLSNEDVVQPDLIFISSARYSEIVQDRVYGAPDLVVEVVSPGTESRDRRVKRQLYERCGVKEYWLVVPALRRIECLSLARRRYGNPQLFAEGPVLSTPLLPGLALPVDQGYLSPV